MFFANGSCVYPMILSALPQLLPSTPLQQVVQQLRTFGPAGAAERAGVQRGEMDPLTI
jgi:hypothetical protein